MSETEAAASLSHQQDLITLQMHLDRTRAAREQERERAHKSLSTLKQSLAIAEAHTKQEQETASRLRREQADLTAQMDRSAAR
eukprot:125831-Rhodomonas_salina.1